MAEQKNLLALYLAVLTGGLCLGIVGMAAVIAPQLLWPEDPSATRYELRHNLDPLEPSPRVAATSSGLRAEIPIRPSDSLVGSPSPSPVRLIIPSINVDAPVVAVGLVADESGSDSAHSTVAVPGRTEAGWYKFGSAPGEAGATVLAGHVDLGGANGVFWDLTELASGASIEVHLSDGSVAEYRTIRGIDFSRDRLPSEELFRQKGAPALHLITCGGAFNRNLGRYESNYVVTAAPVYDNA